MKSKQVKTIGGTFFAVLVVSALTAGLASANEDSKDRRSDGRFVGTWNAQVTLRNCQSGAPIRSFPSTTTFMSGGTMIDSSSGIPQAMKTPGHGVWSHTGGKNYQFKFKSFGFDASGNSAGWTIISHEASVNSRGDELESAGTAEVYAPNGSLVFTGCSSTAATRFE